MVRGALSRVALLVCALFVLAACAPSNPPASAPTTPPAAKAATTAPAAPAATTAPAAKAATPAPAATGTLELTFFYPVAVGGPITKIIEGYADDFNKANPGIKVVPTFAGSYQDTLTKIQTTLEGGGAPPDTAVLLSTDLYALKDADYIVPLEDFVKGSGGDQLTSDFYDAFMLNSRAGGRLWGIPFQRSTPVLYYNTDLFKAAGLDPNQPPKSWNEMVEQARKLTKPEGQQWGLEIPSDGFPYWLFQGMAIGNGKNLVGDAGNKVFFNDPAVVAALQRWIELSEKEKVSPPGITQWATAPNDFTSGKTAMLWHTTGSLTNILKEARGRFDVGVGFLPGLKQNGAPTGGGNFYLFKKTPPERQQAAWKFIQFMSSPEQQARWTIDTGYVAARKSAFETPAMKEYAAKAPQVLVARDQLQFASKELSTHSGPEIQKTFGNALQAALTGKKTPQQAMDDAQKDADKLLTQFPD
jgi:sn-glycerol 3-phosphate transport system substrate-binding protein